MAEEVIDSLEHMKLTADEEDVITIPDEGRLADIENCTLSLIGKFLTCKPFNKEQQKTLSRGHGVWTTGCKLWKLVLICSNSNFK